MAEHGSGVRRLMTAVVLLFIIVLVKQTAAHCGFSSVWKLAAGVDLTVDCRQDDAVLAWSDGDLPYLQEINLYSSCIDPTNTSVPAIRGLLYGYSFGTNSELDPKQWTVRALPGRECSFYGCYAAQGHLRYYTFSTVSCLWTESAGLATPTSVPQPTESSYMYLLPSNIAPNDIRPGIVSRSIYLTSSASDILPSTVYPTPTPSDVSVHPPIITSKVHDENSSGLAPQNTTWMLLPASMNLTTSTSPAFISSTVTTNYTVSASGMSAPAVVWVIPVVLLGFLIVTVSALIATCHIAAQRRTYLKYAVHNGLFDNEDKIDLNFYPVSAAVPFDTLSIRSNVTTYNQLEILHKESNYGVQGTGLANMRLVNTELNKVESFKEDVNYGEDFPDMTNKCLGAEDSGNYVEMNDTSNTSPNASTSLQSTVSTTDTSLPSSIDIASTCTTATKKEKQKNNSQCSMQKTPAGYVLEEKEPGAENTIGNKEQTQTLTDVWNCERDESDSDSDNSFVKIEEDEDCNT